jgi:protein SCO1
MKSSIISVLLAVVSVVLTAVCCSADAASVESRQGPTQTASSPEMSALPGTSLYRLPVSLTTSTGASMQLSEFRGLPLIVTMFYSQCASVCPVLTLQLQHIIDRLSPADRRQIHILMVSFDSVRDSPEALADFKAEHHISTDQWIIARASPKDVRMLAAALGIQYRELSDHTFNHSAILSVTDRDGTVRARTSELNDSDGAFVAAVKRQISGAQGELHPGG